MKFRLSSHADLNLLSILKYTKKSGDRNKDSPISCFSVARETRLWPIHTFPAANRGMISPLVAGVSDAASTFIFTDFATTPWRSPESFMIPWTSLEMSEKKPSSENLFSWSLKFNV
jgi:hypothetical protein